MAQKKRRQHFVPQHLQRNFAIDEKGRRVRIYILKNKKFTETSIKDNLQVPYFYGKSEKVEAIFSDEIEGPVSLTIDKMIKNPKNFMRKNKTLDEETLRYFYTLRNRSVATAKTLDDITNQIMKQWEDSPNFDNSQKKLRREFQEKMVDTNELRGKGALVEPIDESRDKIYNGKYMLISSEKRLYLSDRASTSFFPISPYVLLVIGDMVDIVKHVFTLRSKEYIIDFINSWTINNATNLIIVGRDTTSKDIEKLEKINYHKSRGFPLT